ncbi:MAG: pyridoxal phosphate-dependent aminotransferase [Vicinamibacteria bacterium]|jgi:aspartate aminotransferase|nr:pyridoxal phosphate-dependent aminotransferase [Vicinamibacteria bacterium]
MSDKERTHKATELSRRMLQIPLSPTVAMAQKAAAMKEAGQRVLDFTVGEPDQPTPEHIVEAAVAALHNGRTRYAPSAGLRELRAAVSFRYRRDAKVSFEPEEVMITCGGKQALALACQALFEKGDEVIIPTPHWPTFSQAVRLAGARPILVHALEKDDFAITARMISKSTSPQTRAVILNSPCNPTGAVMDPEDLLVIGDMAQRRRFTILFDDAYGRLTYGRSDAVAFQALRTAVGDRFVILGTASKTYSMTGFRIGWVMGPRVLVDACAVLASHSTQSPATFAQVAAVEALTGTQKPVAEMLVEYKKRRDYIHPAVTAIPKLACPEPGGGFYLFVNVARYLTPAMPTTLVLAERLLQECAVGVVAGEAFGVAGHIRISFARPMEELREGVERLQAFFKQQASE